MSQITFAKDLSRHPLHYFSLLVMELVGLWGLLWFTYDSYMRFAILLSMAAGYVVWGVIHHHQHRDLHIKIVFEYLLMAVLAVLIIGSLIYRT
ncbi:hypothetical protein A3D85_02780 [Candidatus Amesbacteria bacterium RIFCSPHIGHO2_02_FULL_47_9]|uniref:Uncharacterized protein n=1 Tax=Candidatus Amesbacteria bacterium RIFCSPHIGHO2_01_FULL_48_32b TaxID=1797253 RepID=A0A1F4YE28_9BACT|nr:MAG: hypothetical protein A2876_02795 [Candidatus Amesbacteria bacterium RIFCSPHIGHO2_01_FULL_48_32b]OGD02799.1 MAG: hypothetical protein A3D85_02780 [Candidatus Amesbacteria bacterium RIFCSPHIGHO2_02_FULL_47_9]OGD08145.1 MAG: hypothetical protein A2899_02240 [Candidatus Amesbacteria bacterium RIFCSPLOWO2_01_FULL_49_25]